MKVITLSKFNEVIHPFLRDIFLNYKYYLQHSEIMNEFCDYLKNSCNNTINTIEKLSFDMPTESEEPLLETEFVARNIKGLFKYITPSKVYNFFEKFRWTLSYIRDNQFTITKPRSNKWVAVKVHCNNSSWGNWDGDCWEETAYICPKCLYKMHLEGKALNNEFNGYGVGLVYSASNKYCPTCGQEMECGKVESIDEQTCVKSTALPLPNISIPV